MTLYEIDTRLMELADSMFDPDTGELVGDDEAWLELQLARSEKLENTACYIKNLRADVTALEAEEKALAKRRKGLQGRIDWLTHNLSVSLGGQPYETPRVSIKFKRNPESVEFTDEESTMKWAIEHRQDVIKYGKPVLSRSTLKKLLQEGEQIPGAELVQKVRMEVL